MRTDTCEVISLQTEVQCETIGVPHITPDDGINKQRIIQDVQE
jgi:hypothetical protein